ncbi:MAG TPA: ABC transporter ATP-binding protein [Bacteroidia bacterium]|nr:MAG: ABC transporter [Bacteroidetes bacterium OLB10]MBE7510351.1 ABC transporter ATP-binding protein [Bacteroidia bacterium]MBX3106453.1 ABC transporter ATP-binding protein [Bacteroidota bacterium]MCE7955079.1 ABC transporter ATP-binding protein [Bacteroidetes bacterium CHB6]OQB60755.1 MAG: L-cystine import ATP-binding protein TcyC [Bacteroidetes bacterium ADurb.Bin141]
MIDIKNVNKKFGKLHVLKDISVQIKKSNSVALLGPNASGKTTFIKCLLGMLIPDSGTIEINNQSIKGDYKYRNIIGYMPQIGRYPQNMTIEQVFDMILEIRKTALSSADTELMEAFGLKALFSKRMGTLSGGTTQKVSACLAFLFSPEIIILDEPTAGLDPLSSEILKEKIKHERSKGKIILITSHILSELDEMVSEIMYLREGNLVFHSGIEELQSRTGEKSVSKVITSILKTL